MRAITLHQDPPPLLVGERVNSQGSRKVKRLLLADDYDGILDVAREQVDSGAHVLDVCVALTERADEAEQMSKVVKLLSMSVETPLMIDSTEASVIEAALEHIPGRAIINSINMENGRKRIDAVVPLAKKHGAALVALTIDESAWPRRASASSRSRETIYDIVVDEYGLAPEDLIYDALTFTLATGDAGVDRLGATRRSRASASSSASCRASSRILGVSNVSFGLDAGRARGAQLGVPAPLRRRPDSTRRSSTRRTSRRTPRSRRASASWPTISCSTAAGRAAAVHRALRQADRRERTTAGSREGRPDGGHDAGRSACTG